MRWLRHVGDTFRTRSRYLGDSGSGTWVTRSPGLGVHHGAALLFFALFARPHGEGGPVRRVGGVGSRGAEHRAVLEVLDGASVTDVAVLYGVSRKTVHKWLRRYAEEGLKGLADRSLEA